MGSAKTYKQQDMLNAIKGSGGIVSTVAKRLGCQWITAKRYIYKWEATKQAMLDEQETILDMAESKLYESIQNGNTQDAKWLLSTKGKNRGFSERKEHEISGKDGADLLLSVKFVDSTPEEEGLIE